ncbi:hypothetical protein L9F63_026423, partial [Diploptera punctata]
FEIINSNVQQLNHGRSEVADAVRAKIDTAIDIVNIHIIIERQSIFYSTF